MCRVVYFLSSFCCLVLASASLGQGRGFAKASETPFLKCRAEPPAPWGGPARLPTPLAEVSRSHGARGGLSRASLRGLCKTSSSPRPHSLALPNSARRTWNCPDPTQPRRRNDLTPLKGRARARARRVASSIHKKNRQCGLGNSHRGVGALLSRALTCSARRDAMSGFCLPRRNI